MNKNFTILILCYFLLQVNNFSIAQDNHTYVRILGIPDHVQLSRHFTLSDADSFLLSKINQDILNHLYDKGFITAFYEMNALKEDTIEVTFVPGKVHYLKSLKQGNLSNAVLKKVGFETNFFSNKEYRHNHVSSFFNKVLELLENEGYPFASVFMDSLQVEGHEVTASVHCNKGPFITFDSIKVVGETKIKEAFLAAFLQMKYGSPFSQKKFGSIEKKLLQLPFLELLSPPQITFQNNEATVYLHLKERHSSEIDGIIGFLPNENEPEKLLFTGSFILGLDNLGGSAKSLKINWQRLNLLSQNIHLKYVHPNFLHSPFQLQASFDLLKQDTSFLNRYLHFGSSFAHSDHSFFKIYAINKISTTLLQYMEERYNNARSSLFGIGYGYYRLDNFAFPTKGISFDFEVSLGQRQVQNTLDRQEMEPAPQFETKSRFSIYHQLSENIVLFQNMEGASMKSHALLLNEFFRLGGLNSIRGFNENYFFATDYFFINSEIRFIFERKSYITLFYDQAYLSNNSIGPIYGFPLGIGAGFCLSTRNGLFNFMYALGSHKGHPLNFNLSKVHFGYVSRF